MQGQTKAKKHPKYGVKGHHFFVPCRPRKSRPVATAVGSLANLSNGEPNPTSLSRKQPINSEQQQLLKVDSRSQSDETTRQAGRKLSVRGRYQFFPNSTVASKKSSSSSSSANTKSTSTSLFVSAASITPTINVTDADPTPTSLRDSITPTIDATNVEPTPTSSSSLRPSDAAEQTVRNMVKQAMDAWICDDESTESEPSSKHRLNVDLLGATDSLWNDEGWWCAPPSKNRPRQATIVFRPSAPPPPTTTNKLHAGDSKSTEEQESDMILPSTSTEMDKETEDLIQHLSQLDVRSAEHEQFLEQELSRLQSQQPHLSDRDLEKARLTLENTITIARQMFMKQMMHREQQAVASNRSKLRVSDTIATESAVCRREPRRTQTARQLHSHDQSDEHREYSRPARKSVPVTASVTNDVVGMRQQQLLDKWTKEQQTSETRQPPRDTRPTVVITDRESSSMWSKWIDRVRPTSGIAALVTTRHAPRQDNSNRDPSSSQVVTKSTAGLVDCNSLVFPGSTSNSTKSIPTAHYRPLHSK